MKRTISLLFLVSIVCFNLAAQRSTWRKILQNSSYTLRFDPYGLANIDVYNNGSQVTDYSEKLNLVYGKIDAALAQWCEATDYTITMTRVTSGGDYLMTLDALDSVESLGDAGSPIRINMSWGFTINGAQGNRIHFYSAVIHEIGHLFIGLVHCPEDNGSVMWAPSTHTWTYSGSHGGLNDADFDKVKDLYDPASNVTIKITTIKGDVGGNLKIDTDVYWRNISSAGYTASWRPSTFPHSAEVQNGQTVSINSQNYFTNLLQWWKGSTPDGATNPHSLPTGFPEWKANLDLQYNVTFSNYLPGASSSGSLKVNDVTQSSGYTSNVWASTGSVKGEGISQTVDAIQYTFSKWEDNSTTNPQTFNVTDHGSHTAKYTPKPNAPTSVYVSGNAGDQVTLHWTDNPNTNVAHYKILRSWNKGRAYDTVATVNRGVQTWIDEACQITGSYSDSLVGYAVVGRLSYDGLFAFSDKATTSVYGIESYSAKTQNVFPKSQGAIQLPKEYSIGNYPNPFNPSTMIVYSLTENCEVRLEIFDISGRIIKTLVDAQRTAGDHATVWRATDKSGKRVASGTYIYRITARPLSGHQPFVKSGKLVLMK